MIFIISRNLEASTNNVIGWLLSYGVSFERINFGDFFNHDIPFSLSLTPKGRVLQIDDRIYTEKDIKNSVIWFRKTETMSRVKNSKSFNNLYPGIAKHVDKEFMAFTDSFSLFFHDAHWLCDPRLIYLDKMYVLSKAQQCGLQIPSTLLTNNKKILENFEVGKSKITKCIRDGLSVELPDKKRYLLSTVPLTNNQIHDLPDVFFPSTVQSYIDKYIELRIFFIGNEFFTTAIFSQNSERTRIDFRLYVIDNKPCRMSPFNLPDEIKDKLSNLMREIGINTGSIDMIVSDGGGYYFLEVNPYGQYGHMGDACNYMIDKTIADYLVKNDHGGTFRKINH